jgi:hypothetical protein
MTFWFAHICTYASNGVVVVVVVDIEMIKRERDPFVMFNIPGEVDVVDDVHNQALKLY